MSGLAHSGPRARPFIPTELVARLEFAPAGSRDLDREVMATAKALVDPSSPCAWGTCPTTSLDDAIRLMARVLPDWVIASMEWWPQRDRAGLTMREVKDFEQTGGFGFGFNETCGDARANARTPALAVCAAVLRAVTANLVGTPEGVNPK